jgi:DNA-binding GntR family transcriptional regulator
MQSISSTNNERGIVRPNLDTFVCDTVREMIFGGELRIGERIVEEKLAGTLNVSRTPIKLSLMQLAREGIVEHIPRKGAFVKVHSKKEIIEYYEIRAALYELSARLAIARMTNEDLEGLNAIMSEHEKFAQTIFIRGNETLTSGDYSKHLLLDRDFHLTIAKMARNEKLTEELRNSCFVLNFFILLSPNTNLLLERIQIPLTNHRQIYDSIARRDVEAATRLSREHSMFAAEIVKTL